MRKDEENCSNKKSSGGVNRGCPHKGKDTSLLGRKLCSRGWALRDRQKSLDLMKLREQGTVKV